ncbi:hypothetical protein AOLI_G00322020 [Acnodon oligacanthus]
MLPTLTQLTSQSTRRNRRHKKKPRLVFALLLCVPATAMELLVNYDKGLVMNFCQDLNQGVLAGSRRSAPP